MSDTKLKVVHKILENIRESLEQVENMVGEIEQGNTEISRDENSVWYREIRSLQPQFQFRRGHIRGLRRFSRNRDFPSSDQRLGGQVGFNSCGSGLFGYEGEREYSTNKEQ